MAIGGDIVRADASAIANTRQHREGAEPDSVTAYPQLWRVRFPNRCAPADRESVCGPACGREGHLARDTENARGARCHHPGDDDASGRGWGKGVYIL